MVFLKFSQKLIGKHLGQSLFFNKVAGLDLKLIENRLHNNCFPVNLAKFLRKPFL